MRSDRQRRIEQRAHEIWEAEGRPHGKHEEHWQRAEREITGGRGARASGSGGKSTVASKSSASKPRAKTDASAKKTGGATSRAARPAASARSGSASTRGRAKPAGTQST